MAKISYEVVQSKRGFDAVKWTTWPDRDQFVHPPLPVTLNTYPTREAAVKACEYDASWQHVRDADAGRSNDIVCEVGEEES